MRTSSAYRATFFLAQNATKASEKTAKARFRIVSVALTTLFLLFPFAAHSEDTAPPSFELESNPLLVLARIVKQIESPPFQIISLLSGGRINIVLPPKLILNKLMDGVIEGTAPRSPELKSNPLLVLARIVKRIGPPPFHVINLLSSGRVNIVLPPKLILNKLMDGVIVLVANK